MFEFKDSEEIKALKAAPKNGDSIEAARKLQGWLAFFNKAVQEVDISTDYEERARASFFKYYKDLLSEKKYERQVQVFLNDVPAIIDEVSLELSSVHEAEDREIYVDFSSPEDQSNYAKFRIRELKDEALMKSKAIPVALNNVNSYVFVTKETFFFIDINEIIDVDEKHNGFCKYIIFKEGEETIAVDSVNVWRLNKEGELESKEPHKAGEIPVKSFWSDTYRLDNSIVKDSLLYTSFPAMKRFIRHQNGRDAHELYAKYLIIQMRKPKCTNATVFEGKRMQCNSFGTISGYYKDAAGEEKHFSQSCKSCEAWNLISAGTVVQTLEPVGENIRTDDPIKFVVPDSSILKYNQEASAEYKNAVISSIITFFASVLTAKQVNKDQVAALAQHKERVFFRVAKNLEEIHRFILRINAKLNYPSSFRDVVSKYGRSFFVLSSDQLADEYREAKAKAAPVAELDERYTKYIKGRYSSNPPALERQLMLFNLEPYFHNDLAEVAEMNAAGKVSNEDAVKKTKWSDLIKWFERVHSRVNEFAPEAAFEKRIEGINALINAELEEYMKTVISSTEKQIENEQS